MKEITHEMINTFRSPAFPGSYFLSFEGIEGAGKSTHISKIKNYLEEQKNFRVLVFREPGGTSFGEKLRSAILGNTNEITPLAEAHLFASSRSQLLSEVILHELSVPNTIVICDRYIDSSMAYQGFARGLGIAEIMQIHNIFPLNLVPHLTFYLRIDVETSEKRQKIRNAPKDYFESKGMTFYKKLVDGYDMLCELFPHRICKINAEESIDTIQVQLVSIIENLITAKTEVIED